MSIPYDPTVDWEEYRLPDHSIDLELIFRKRNQDNPKSDAARGQAFLARVMLLQPIVSRQVAAVALAFAELLADPLK